MKTRGLICLGLIAIIAIMGWLWAKYYATGGKVLANRDGQLLPQGNESLRGTRIGGTREISSGITQSAQSGDLLVLLEEWLSATYKNDGTRSEGVIQRLTELLHGNPKGYSPVYARIQQILTDPSLAANLKFGLVNMLARAATPAAVRTLVDVYRQGLPPELKQSVANALSQTGDYYWDKRLYPEVAPMLIQSWQDAEDLELLRALATAIVRVGDAYGVGQVLDTVLSNGTTIAQIQANQDLRSSAALFALDSVHNPDLAPALAKRMSGDDVSSAEESICGGILASMQNIEAARYLLEWVQNAEDSSAGVVPEVFSKIGDKDSLDYLSLTVLKIPFKSNVVRTAVLSSLHRP